MPPKKSVGGQSKSSATQEPPTLLLPDGGDPALVAIAIVEKKKRNLEKRKNKLESLKEGLDSGTRLDSDQVAAVARLNDVTVQLELIKELQKQFTTLQSEFQKSRKRQQKIDRASARESEHEAERRAVVYTLRVTNLLTNIGDEDKENFRTGTNGAVLLTEDELTQLDETYSLLAPSRQPEPTYGDELSRASEFVQQLMEQSTKETLGTTYKQLYSLLQKIDGCGYFDRALSETENGEEEEEGVADEEDYRSAEDTLPLASEDVASKDVVYEEAAASLVREELEPTYLPPTQPPPPQEPETVVQPDILSGYVPSVPSPTFPGLGPSPVQPTASDAFSFMHDSEVDRGSLQAVPQPPTTLDNTPLSPILLPTAPNTQYTQFPDRLVPGDITKLPSTLNQPGGGGDLAATDVATGQPSQNTAPYQGSGLMNSAPPSGSYQYGGGAMGDESAGYQNQFGAPVRVGGQSRSGRGGGGGRRGGGAGPGGPKGGGVHRNGRGPVQGEGGYDMSTNYTSNTSNRGYSSAGGYPPRGGGRPNYRTGQGPRK